MKRILTYRAGLAALAALLLIGAAVVAGCSGGSTPESTVGAPGIGGGATGILRMSLTDAPFPFDMIDHAELTIDRVSIHLEDATTDDGSDMDDDGDAEDSTDVDSTDVEDEGTDDADGADGEFLVLDDQAQTVDLMDLRNGVTSMLVEAEIPVGTIDQIRLRVTDASVTLTDGRVFELIVPSGSTSGLKAYLDPAIPVVGNLTTDLLLDVDMSRSFLAIPAAPTKVDDIRSFKFHPTLRVANLSEAGSISGTVLGDGGTAMDTSDDTPIEGATVTAMASDGTDYTTATDADGHFVLMGLPEGTYTLTVEATDYQTDGRSVTVVAANDAGGIDFLLVDTADSGS